MDTNLAALFASSAPVSKPKPRPAGDRLTAHRKLNNLEHEASENSESSDDNSDGSEVSPPDSPVEAPRASKKRKKAAEEDLEDVYFKKLARETDREGGERKRVKTTTQEQNETSDGDDQDGDDQSEDGNVQDSEQDSQTADFEIPQHETVASKDQGSEKIGEVEKASRTVFLGNVSVSCISSKADRRELEAHLTSFCGDLPTSGPKHKLESLRFRSTAFSTASLPKKAAFAKKELMEATTKSTNAYAVYTTQAAARAAVTKLNGTVVLERHLRVDGVAHPAKVDNRRCVFVGNLGFVDDESNIRSAEAEESDKKPRKSKPAGDVEEGLWQQFSKAGEVESVRVVRDKMTRVGKGFAYVQFKNGNAVEKALLFNEKKYPPLLPRTLRVTRAKNVSKSNGSKDTSQSRPKSQSVYVPKASSDSRSFAGRAAKLLGRAGASQHMKMAKKGVVKTPEDVVFEGHRARESQGKGTLFKKGKKQGKPTTRSSRRGADFKKAKGKRA